MAHTRIIVDPSKSVAAGLLEALDAIATGKGELNRILELMVPMIDGADYSQIATETGCAAGEAQSLYNLVNGAIGILDGANDLYNCITRVDQG